MRFQILALSAAAVSTVSALPSAPKDARASAFQSLKFDGKSAKLFQRDSGSSYVVTEETNSVSSSNAATFNGTSPKQSLYVAGKGLSTGTTTVDPSAAAYADPVSVIDGPSDGKWIINEKTNGVVHVLNTAEDSLFACQVLVSTDVYETVLSFGKVGPNGELPERCVRTEVELVENFPTGAPAPAPKGAN